MQAHIIREQACDMGNGKGEYIFSNNTFKGEPAMWRKFYDGWFEYYYNIETGERKFKLDPDDILIE